MFTIAVLLGVPINEDTFRENMADGEACCTGGGSAFNTTSAGSWSLFMCCAPQQDPEYLTLHFKREGREVDGADELAPFHVPPDMELARPADPNNPNMK